MTEGGQKRKGTSARDRRKSLDIKMSKKELRSDALIISRHDIKSVKDLDSLRSHLINLYDLSDERFERLRDTTVNYVYWKSVVNTMSRNLFIEIKRNENAWEVQKYMAEHAAGCSGCRECPPDSQIIGRMVMDSL